VEGGGAGGQTGVEGKGKEETAGRYSFAVPAVVIYLKPLAVNISPSFIQRHGEAPVGGLRGGGGGGTGVRLRGEAMRGCKLCVPSYLGSSTLLRCLKRVAAVQGRIRVISSLAILSREAA
jgi:hypothetical protein